MEIIIEGNPKEIAALVLELQERQGNETQKASVKNRFVHNEDGTVTCLMDEHIDKDYSCSVSRCNTDLKSKTQATNG